MNAESRQTPRSRRRNPPRQSKRVELGREFCYACELRGFIRAYVDNDRICLAIKERGGEETVLRLTFSSAASFGGSLRDMAEAATTKPRLADFDAVPA